MTTEFFASVRGYAFTLHKCDQTGFACSTRCCIGLMVSKPDPIFCLFRPL